MNGKMRPIQSTELALEWYKQYYIDNGQLPGNAEVDLLNGPTWRLRQRLGGTVGIVMRLGLGRDALNSNYYLDEGQTIESISRWIEKTERTEEAPLAKTYKEDYKLNHPLTLSSFQAIQNKFGTWEAALEATGLFRFNFDPSECVSTCVLARKAFPELDLRSAIRKYNKKGINPNLENVIDHYGSIRGLSTQRLSWNKWLEMNKADQRRKNASRILSLGVLGLAQVNGNVAKFQQGIGTLVKEDRAPEFSRNFFAAIAGERPSMSQGYIYALDAIESIYFRETEDSQIKIAYKEKSALAGLSHSEIFNPYFEPELREAIARVK